MTTSTIHLSRCRPALRFLRLLVCVTTAVAVTSVAAPAAAETAQGGDTNEAVAVNTEDGGSIFRFAFSIRKVADGTVDQENLAVAYASCTDCRTVALAFQVVLVMGGADVVAPVNQAVAYNDQCVECVTFASATQIVVGVGGPMVLTKDGRTQLHDLQKSFKDVEAELAEMTVQELAAWVAGVKTQLIDIVSSELVPAGKSDEAGEPTAASTPTTAGTASSTTTAATSTSSVEATISTTTTTAASNATTTTVRTTVTTAAPTTEAPGSTSVAPSATDEPSSTASTTTTTAPAASSSSVDPVAPTSPTVTSAPSSSTTDTATTATGAATSTSDG